MTEPLDLAAALDRLESHLAAHHDETHFHERIAEMEADVATIRDVLSHPAPVPALDVEPDRLRLALRSEMGWSAFEVEDFLQQHNLTTPCDLCIRYGSDGCDRHAALTPEEPRG